MKKLNTGLIIILLLIPIKIVSRIVFNYTDSDKTLSSILIFILLSLLVFNSKLFGDNNKLGIFYQIIFTLFILIVYETINSV